MARDCEIEIILEPGSYIVVPRTTGCNIQRPNEDAEEVNLPLLDENGEMNQYLSITVEDIFRKFDLVINNLIDFKEFKGLFDIIGKKITEVEFKNILQEYTSYENGLTMRGFKQWFVDQIKQNSKETIFDWLNKLGYDKDYYSIRSRLFTISFHSKTF